MPLFFIKFTVDLKGALELLELLERKTGEVKLRELGKMGRGQMAEILYCMLGCRFQIL
jgi:hypothetical protein